MLICGTRAEPWQKASWVDAAQDSMDWGVCGDRQPRAVLAPDDSSSSGTCLECCVG